MNITYNSNNFNMENNDSGSNIDDPVVQLFYQTF